MSAIFPLALIVCN